MYTTRHASRRRRRQARLGGAALGLKGAPLRNAADLVGVGVRVRVRVRVR